MIEAGQVLQGRYRVEKQIGQGGMGAVFVATDERFGSTVAIKETFFTDEKLRKAFEREARLLNSLRHPALPRVSDHFIEGNGQFLVMEFIDGEDLSEQLEAGGKVFPVDEILGWAAQLLDAIEYLHGQEMPVIHRDIKPQNLKLTPRGQIILLDFGLAKGTTTNAESATAAKSVFGYSRNYASIEQIQGSGTDPRSDLYSLAATLYHLLTGVPPADALTRAMNVLSSKPDPLIEPDRIRPEIPWGISRVLVESMALSAAERPASARAMRERLAAARHLTAPPAADAADAAGAAPAAGIFSQPTQIQEAPPFSAVPPPEAATGSFADDESKVTRLKPPHATGDFENQQTKIHPLASAAPAAPAAEKKPSRALAIGAALGALLLAGSAALATYVYRPGFFGAAVEPANFSAAPNPAPSAPPADAGPALAETDANAANAAVPSAPNAPSANTAPEAKPRENAARADAKTEPAKPAGDARSETKAKSEVTIVTRDRSEPTAAEADPDEDLPPPPKPDGKSIPPAVWKKMTPEERRQLRFALELQRQIDAQRRRQPRPQPVPPRPGTQPTPQK